MSAADEGVSLARQLRRQPDAEVEYLSEDWYRTEFPGFPDDRIYKLLAQKSLGIENKETCTRSKSKKGRKSTSKSRR